MSIEQFEKLSALLESTDFGGVRLRLYDIESPGRAGGTLRIYIARALESAGTSDAQEQYSGQSLAGAEQNAVVLESVVDAPQASSACSASLEDCARVSRFLLESPLLEELFPGECTIEVSSPGINRRLRYAEHFKGAVGERVRLVVDRKRLSSEGSVASAGRVTLIGNVLACDDKELVLQLEVTGKKQKRQRHKAQRRAAVAASAGEELRVPLEAIGEARVDFLFA
jgi:ribosome maturation factor RimP